jgi:DNA repair exonuclease SbcCD ATPase subunit
MKVKIEKMIFKNFKGHVYLAIDFKDRTSIFGMNKVGKTTIQDAFRWMFFGKHAEGKSDLDIKTKCTTATKPHFPKNKIGDVVHNLKHSVELIINVDGRKIELKKEFSETWGKTGKIKEKHLKTHETKYWFDDRSVKKKEYESSIAEIVDEEIFRILTEPEFFCGNPKLHWSARRTILKSLTGELEKASIEGYALVKDMIEHCTPEQKKKALKDELKLTKDERDQIPIKVDECQGFIIEIPKEEGPSKKELEEDKNMLRELISDFKSDSGQTKRKLKLEEIQAEIIKANNAFVVEKNEKLAKIDDQISSFQDVDLQKELNDLKSDLEESKESLANAKEERANIFEDWKFWTNRKESVDTECPTCSQEIPEEMRQKAIEEFNIEKSSNIERIEKIGKLTKDWINKLEEKIKSIPDKIQEKQKELTEIDNKLDSLREEQKEIRGEKPDNSELEAKKAQIQQEIEEQKPVDTSDFESQIAAIDSQIQAINKRKLDIQKNGEYQGRIKELEGSESFLSQKIANLEEKILLLENFINAEVQIVEESVNKEFEFTTFKMFHHNINEGIKEICEAMNDGILYASVNSAGRIQSGIDVIRRLQKLYGLTLPIFIDNRESVTEIPEVDCQVISLLVSPEDKQLRIEHS